MLYVNDEEIAHALKRYNFFVNILNRLLGSIEPGLVSDNRWFSVAPKIAGKFWKQALSLEILFKHEWTIERNGEEKILLDISSFYSLIRGMYES